MASDYWQVSNCVKSPTIVVSATSSHLAMAIAPNSPEIHQVTSAIDGTVTTVGIVKLYRPESERQRDAHVAMRVSGDVQVVPIVID